MKYTFKTKLWEYQAPLKDGTGHTTVWVMATVPSQYYADIRELTGPLATKGFGSVRVEVGIGKTVWKTSIFPDTKSNSYVLPVKKEVRKKEHLDIGDSVEVTIALVGL